MMTFTITLEVNDFSLSDGEDIQMVLEDIFQEHLPSDLTARVVDIEASSEIE
jgi:hypothetical protein